MKPRGFHKVVNMTWKMTASQFKEFASLRRKKTGDQVIHSIKSIALEGAPGMGKTSVIRSLGTDWELPVITVAINQWVNSADIVGFAYKGRMGDMGGFEIAGEDDIPAWLPVYRVNPANKQERVETSDKTKGWPVWHDENGQAKPHPAIVLLDEFSAARPAVQSAFLSVAIDKVVKNFRLDSDTNFFIAFNSCDRAGFESQNNEISAALVGPNGRFDCIELVYEDAAVRDAVLANPNISDFWKQFTSKKLADLKICNDDIPNDYNSCGRTYESLMLDLSNGGYDSKNFPNMAEMLVKINFDGSPKLAEQFIIEVKNFDIPTGIDFLNGTAVPKDFADAIVGIKAMGTLFGFRNRAKEKVISPNEIEALKEYLSKDYPTGSKKADGTPIIGSQKELYMTMKVALLRECLETRKEFKFVADTIKSFDEPASEDDNDDEF
jgi:hypothetical protein